MAGADLTAYLRVQNVLDADNVLDVYGNTGSPDDDGFLQTGAGRAWLATRSSNAELLYRYRTSAPLRHGLPRLVRLGIVPAY